MRIQYASALSLSLPQIAEIQTAAFGGSWISSPAKLAEIFRVQSVDLALSLIAYDGRKPIGLAVLGRRRNHGWLYDFGIAPAYRGRGLGTRLLQTTTREAIKVGVRDIELDVWEQRADAIRLYGRAGFQHVRTYLNFQASGAHLRLSQGDLPATWQVRACPVHEITPWYAVHKREPEPAWDRRLSSLLIYGDAQACVLRDDTGDAAFMHYAARAAEGTDPHRIRPMFIGLRDGAGVEHLRALLAFAAGRAFNDLQSTVFRVALEPETSTLARLLTASEMEMVGRALDMRLRFEPTDQAP